jgi:hypothetical protein
MKFNFDFDNVATTEFGVGRDDNDQTTFRMVVVDAGVQVALRDMIAATRDAMSTLTKAPTKYEPSERYESCEHVHLPLNDEFAHQIRILQEADNLPADSKALLEPSNVFCYFARTVDKQGRRLTAVRRATQFKGVLKSRLIRLATDAMRIIEDRVFKLDNDFDMLIDSMNVHILRPSGFQGYAITHARAARYLASIRAQDGTKNIDRRSLKDLCKATGVEIHETDGKIAVEEDQIIGFLEVLDRRRYEVALIKNSPERFRAASRRKLANEGETTT